MIVDGSDPNTAGLVLNYAEGVFNNWLVQESLSRSDLMAPKKVLPSIATEPRYWFNSEIRSKNFLIPGSVAIIMSLIGTLLTALVIVREWSAARSKP